MVVEEILLGDIVVMKKNPLVDSRGFFERVFCVDELESFGVDFACVQQNISFNEKKGTIRGLHYQLAPYDEKKLIQCIRGKVYDVLVDVDADSDNYGKHVMIELSEDNHRIIFVPSHYAHGFQTLEDNTMMLYHMGNYYKSDMARGINCFSKSLNIDWPIINDYIISDKDEALPEFYITEG